MDPKRLSKMKWLSILFCLSFMCCAASPIPKEIAKPEAEISKRDIPKIDITKTEPVPFHIFEVKVDRKVFNPSQGEVVTISYRVSRPAKVIIKIFDPEMVLVRDLTSESRGGSGPNQVIWDGRDLAGRIIADEAYFFTIEASDYQGKFIFYDPTTISGGESLSPQLNFDKEKNRIFYQLPKDARVRIRAGISSGGPLLKNILNGVPRLSGNHEEVWDGKDGAGAIDVVSQKNFLLSVEANSLPENSIVANGNEDYDYLKYRNDIAPDRPKKVERPLFQSKMARLAPLSSGPLIIAPEPRFNMELPEMIRRDKKGLPVVEGKTSIKIYLDPKIKRYITEQRYEILFFVDFRFITEMEEGYSPFTLVWDTRVNNNGEHIITVNVVTLTGQVSSGSMRVKVKN